MPANAGRRIQINGIVQGVGFRPFVYSLAERFQLTGWVKNTTAGVEIEVDGTPEMLSCFTSALQTEAPPLSQINIFEVEEIPENGFSDFNILVSEVKPDGFQPVSPDVSICDQCLQEMNDPNDRRYLYPFINCTNCGPRFTIIKDLPYDRPLTTMAGFPLCEDCAEEYHNPADRRFHAQPVACPVCGPEIWLVEKATNPSEETFSKSADSDTTIPRAQELLTAGQILAVKGLGGFHLACDAQNGTAVKLLRNRKKRPHKPMAVMMPDLDTIRGHCEVNQEEEKLLSSVKRPIVLLKQKQESNLANELNPGQNHLGVMLPYTPLHYLLFKQDQESDKNAFEALVMTSGNLSDNPIEIDNTSAEKNLGEIVDGFLYHNRDIYVPCDDSVARIMELDQRQFKSCYLLRRSRGYSPNPVILDWETDSILAVGAEQKNAFCLTRDNFAFLSQHIGDIKNFETLENFESSILHFEDLFRTHPSIIAHDLHPDYLSTRYAIERAEEEGIPALGVQHHHAHIAACLADNNHAPGSPVLGVAFDGTGYGSDGAIWGGEFLLADYQEFKRVFHLKYIPLPGGDLAVREPWRMALSLLNTLDLPWDTRFPPVKYALSIPRNSAGIRPLDLLRRQLASGINAPDTSSMGRLFDAAASLLGIRQTTSYEGQAAVELEAIVDPAETAAYSFEILPDGIINPGPVFEEMIRDLFSGIQRRSAAAKFHNAISNMILAAAEIIQERYSSQTIALSGGVWQNATLLAKTYDLLQTNGFIVLIHQTVPANDGGIAFGQAAAAHFTLQE
jgi:hydrogenase maturation protein HypF